MKSPKTFYIFRVYKKLKKSISDKIENLIKESSLDIQFNREKSDVNPEYLYLYMSKDDLVLTSGIHGLRCMPSVKEPVGVTEDEINKFFVEVPVINKYAIGNTVYIKSGLFQNYSGKIVNISGKHGVTVIINVFGSENEITVDFDNLA